MTFQFATVNNLKSIKSERDGDSAYVEFTAGLPLNLFCDRICSVFIAQRHINNSSDLIHEGISCLLLKNNAAKALLINLLLEVVRNEYQKRRFFLYGLFLFELKRIRSLNNFVYIRELRWNCDK